MQKQLLSNHHLFDCADIRGSLGISKRAVHPHTYGGKRVGMQADPQRDTQKRQRRTGNLVERVPQTPMISHTQGINATSLDTAIDLCDDAALEASTPGSASSLARRATRRRV